jgi:hypothetical protein
MARIPFKSKTIYESLVPGHEGHCMETILTGKFLRVEPVTILRIQFAFFGYTLKS